MLKEVEESWNSEGSYCNEKQEWERQRKRGLLPVFHARANLDAAAASGFPSSSMRFSSRRSCDADEIWEMSFTTFFTKMFSNQWFNTDFRLVLIERIAFHTVLTFMCTSKTDINFRLSLQPASRLTITFVIFTHLENIIITSYCYRREIINKTNSLELHFLHSSNFQNLLIFKIFKAKWLRCFLWIFL